MKRHLFLIALLLVLAAEIATLIFFSVQTPSQSQDAVTVNEVLQTVTRDFDALDSHKNNTALNYVVLDNSGEVLFKTRDGLSENVNAAITHGDTMLDVVIDDITVGKIIIYSDGAQAIQAHKQTAIAVLSVAAAVQAVLCIGYTVFLYVTVIGPFRKLKGFAERIADGNLDIPLLMDRGNVFGAFTESFDIMRSELKKARLAEAAAQQSKKELVAKLSHDIKTPIASIKAVSEVGLAVAESEKDRANYTQIIGKSDQINTLVTNLFTATLEELQQLSVVPADIDSKTVKKLLLNADYMHRADIPDLPECLLCADRLRLQQVFDNIFANSYKYADTDIVVEITKGDGTVDIAIEDNGGGVKSEELPILKEKFKRGSNTQTTEGAGLGLYISDYFMKEMGGSLDIQNGAHGLKVVVRVRIVGKN